MVSNIKNAQKWIDSEYPKEKRYKNKELNISDESLEGSLILESFINLQKLDCSNNLLTGLSLVSCNVERLVEINVENNNFSEQDLSFLKEAINLEKLYLGTTKQERIKKGIRNRFIGSLEPLKKMTKLKELGVSSTDINSGLNFLPDSLKRIYCVNYCDSDAGCEEIQKKLKNHLKHLSKNVKYYDFQAWLKTSDFQTPSQESLLSSSLKLHPQISTDVGSIFSSFHSSSSVSQKSKSSVDESIETAELISLEIEPESTKFANRYLGQSILPTERKLTQQFVSLVRDLIERTEKEKLDLEADLYIIQK